MKITLTFVHKNFAQLPITYNPQTNLLNVAKSYIHNCPFYGNALFLHLLKRYETKDFRTFSDVRTRYWCKI